MQKRSRVKLRFKESDVTSAIFKILHEPPMQAWRVRTTGQLPSGAPPRALQRVPVIVGHSLRA